MPRYVCRPESYVMVLYASKTCKFMDYQGEAFLEK